MLTLKNTIIMEKPGEVLENLTLEDIAGVAVVVRAPNCRAYNVTVNGCDLSAFMLEDGADGFTWVNVKVSGYNRSNTNGHAAIFANPKGRLQSLRGSGLIISNGNGNCVRLTSVEGFEFSDSEFSDTHGNSSEGATANKACKRGRFHHITFRNSNTDHLLFWGPGHEDIEIDHNRFINAGMINDGTHPAIGIQPQGGIVSAIDIHDNCFSDERATPLTACGVMAYGAGKIRWRQPYRNQQWGCAYKEIETPANSSTVVFEDWQ